MRLFKRRYTKWERMSGFKQRISLENGWVELRCRKGHRKMYNPRGGRHAENNLKIWISNHSHN